KDVLEECGESRALARGPREMLVELREGVGQPEEAEVVSESLERSVVAGGGSVVSGLALGHDSSCGGGSVDGAACAKGSRSYSVRARGSAGETPRVCSSRRAVSSATYSSSVRGAERASTIRSTAAYSSAPKRAACASATSRSRV